MIDHDECIGGIKTRIVTSLTCKIYDKHVFTLVSGDVKVTLMQSYFLALERR